ncbi:MAG: hypothetical protein R3B49_05420 [Phycisphaerales bacterium]
MKANDLKPGTACGRERQALRLREDRACPSRARGPAYVGGKLRAVDGSGTTEKRFSGSDDIRGVTLDRRSWSSSSPTAGAGHLHGPPPTSTVELNSDILGGALLYLAPNAQCTMLFQQQAHHHG